MLLSEVAKRLLASSSVRVDIGEPTGWELYWNGEALAATETVHGAGLTALDMIVVRRVPAVEGATPVGAP
jgi:hypothetical protein